jgi:hypothetical protein
VSGKQVHDDESMPSTEPKARQSSSGSGFTIALDLWG